mmetsp:Transcript_2015/g.2878  ORF Transcript_2015/g.2878 Transcript_2015/m.2878 type:complete len:80 (+) Transcript_2015:939-1178(+)
MTILESTNNLTNVGNIYDENEYIVSRKLFYYFRSAMYSTWHPERVDASRDIIRAYECMGSCIVFFASRHLLLFIGSQVG